MHRTPIIIDTDPGLDDFFALLLAKSAEHLEIKAITSVAGNQTLEKTTQNMLDIAQYASIDTRLAKGASKPLNKDLHTASKIHGEKGIGSVELVVSTKVIDKDYAWDVMYQEALKAEGKLKIVAIGPLTNIAIALLKYPELKHYIEEIVLMGGSATRGNRMPYSEFNIWVDPLAADLVFKSQIPITMIGLDATRDSLLNAKDIEAITYKTSRIQTVVQSIVGDLKKVHERFGIDGIVLHDALAVAYLIRKEVVQTEEYYVAIETKSSLNRGRTVVDVNDRYQHKKNAKVAMTADHTIFMEMIDEMLTYYAEKV